MKRSRLWAMIWTSLVVFIIAGWLCGSAGRAVAAGSRVSLTVWDFGFETTSPWGAALNQLHKQFVEKHPGWTIKEGMPVDTIFDRGKLVTAIAGGAGPDVFFENRWALQNVASSGLYQPIGDWANELEIRADDFIQGPWLQCLWNGQLYGIPHHTDARGLFWNVDLLEEAGLDGSKPPTTWMELQSYTVKLTRRDADGRIALLGFDPYYFPDALYLFAMGNNARFISPDDRTASLTSLPVVQALDYMVSLTNQLGGRDAVDAFYSTWGGMEASGLPKAFVLGKMAMMGGGNWLVKDLIERVPDLRFDVGPMPVPEGHTFATWGGGFAYAVPVGAKHGREAMELVKFLVSHEAQVYWGTRTTHIPVLKSALVEIIPKVDKRQAKFLQIVLRGRMYTLPGGPVGPLVFRAVIDATREAIYGKKSVENALRNAQERAQSQIDRYYEMMLKK